MRCNRVTGSPKWRCLPVFALIIALMGPALCSATEKDDNGDLLNFLAGTYGVIGKMPGDESAPVYSGLVTIRRSGSKLEITRCIGGARHKGEGSIVPVTGDRIMTMQYRWQDGKNKYEGRYDIHSDIDNYARLSGPFVHVGNSGRFGWELLYFEEDVMGKCR